MNQDTDVSKIFMDFAHFGLTPPPGVYHLCSRIHLGVQRHQFQDERSQFLFSEEGEDC